MPNWCENQLKITGPDKDLHAFIEENAAGEGETLEPLLFNLSVPLPPESEENWYIWCLENWGTKWEPNASPLEPELPEELTAYIRRLEADKSISLRSLAALKKEDFESIPLIEWIPVLADYWRIREQEIMINLSTAWGPPVKWLEKVSAKYPTLDFILTYDEPGMAFRGTASGSCGEIFNAYEEYDAGSYSEEDEDEEDE